MSRIVLFLLVLSPLSIIHSPALAQEKVQMVFEEFVAPDLKANLMIVGNPTLK